MNDPKSNNIHHLCELKKLIDLLQDLRDACFQALNCPDDVFGQDDYDRYEFDQNVIQKAYNIYEEINVNNISQIVFELEDYQKLISPN